VPTTFHLVETVKKYNISLFKKRWRKVKNNEENLFSFPLLNCYSLFLVKKTGFKKENGKNTFSKKQQFQICWNDHCLVSIQHCSRFPTHSGDCKLASTSLVLFHPLTSWPKAIRRGFCNAFFKKKFWCCKCFFPRKHRQILFLAAESRRVQWPCLVQHCIPIFRNMFQ
jgi:hypothetical protein